jgi:hypothetical protein
MTTPTKSDLDPECVRLCDALNGMPGVSTFSSCSGQGERPLYVAFTAASLEALQSVAAKVSEQSGWRVEVGFKAEIGLVFRLVGGVGSETFKSALELAERIEAEL